MTETITESIEDEFSRMKREMEDIKSEMEVARIIKNDLSSMSTQNSHLQAELATYQRLYKESQKDLFDHRRESLGYINHLKTENDSLKDKMKNNSVTSTLMSSSNLHALTTTTTDVFDATKSFANKMKSNILNQSKSDASTSKSPTHEEESNELSMVKPLEEQISALKEKLRSMDCLIREREQRESENITKIDSVAKWLLECEHHHKNDKSQARNELLNVLSLLDPSNDVDTDSEQRKLQKNESYVSILSFRYSLLVQELNALRTDNDRLSVESETARTSNKKLKQALFETNSELLNVKSDLISKEVIIEGESIVGNENDEPSTHHSNVENSSLKSRCSSEASISTCSISSSPVNANSLLFPIQSLTALPSSEKRKSLANQINLNQNCIEDNSKNSADDEEMTLVSKQSWDRVQNLLNSLMNRNSDNKEKESSSIGEYEKEIDVLKCQRDDVLRECDELKDKLICENEYRQKCESNWKDIEEDCRNEIEKLVEMLKCCESTITDLINKYHSLYSLSQHELQMMTSDRETIVSEMRNLQLKVENLTAKYEMETLHDDDDDNIQLPDASKLKDVHLTLLQFRDKMIRMKIGREENERVMNSQLKELRGRLSFEIEEKEKQKEDNKTEIDNLKSENERLKESEKRLESMFKDGNTVNKSEHENKMKELHIKLVTSQTELDTAVEVQNDFVRLSQSLQMQLEKIRQSETEVRWQHDDDVRECQGCRLIFSRPGMPTRNKHHCRHCGHIFCSSCVSKNVIKVGLSGIKRQFKVCDVCHTLLDRKSVPFFATSSLSPSSSQSTSSSGKKSSPLPR